MFIQYKRIHSIIYFKYDYTTCLGNKIEAKIVVMRDMNSTLFRRCKWGNVYVTRVRNHDEWTTTERHEWRKNSDKAKWSSSSKELESILTVPLVVVSDIGTLEVFFREDLDKLEFLCDEAKGELSRTSAQRISQS